ncbi:MAG: hypothetical protein LBC37_03135, partial [Zoogloeaceae bacterium]|nr:hypothetical protein [Zoogloeaceae bacterium]
AFALLPAQNATGNWIKIVQRVPVKIELEAEDLRAHPLRIGLSMRVTVDLHDHDAPAATPAAPDTALDATPNVLPTRNASDAALDAARARIREIIRQHDIHEKYIS